MCCSASRCAGAAHGWRCRARPIQTRRASSGKLPRRMKKEDFIAFLEYLLTVYTTQVIILIVDNYSSHTAHDVADWLAAHPRLQLHFLPKYCSHLNPVEPIWLQMKGQIAANRLYGSIKLVLAAVDRFFARMTPAQALTWAGAEK